MGSRRRGWKSSNPSREWKCLRLRLLATSCKIRFLFPKGKPLVVSNAALYTAILASIFIRIPSLVSGYCKAPETGASRSPLVLPGCVSVPPSLFGPVQTPSIAMPRGRSLHVADCVMRFDCADKPGLFLCNDDRECFILCHHLTLLLIGDDSNIHAIEAGAIPQAKYI